MTWSFRVFHRRVRLPMLGMVGDLVDVWEVREAYYDERGEVAGWSQHPLVSSDVSLDDLADELRRVLAAVDAPVVELSDDGRSRL